MEVAAPTKLEELKLLLDQLGPAFDILPDAIRVVDMEGRAIYVNRAFLHLTGYSSAEILHRPVLDTFTEDDRSRIQAALHSVLKNGQWLGTMEARIKRKGGDPVMVSLNCAAMKNNRHEIIGGFAVFRDVSRMERILAEPIELLSLSGSPVEILRQLPARVATYFPGRPWVMINLVEGEYLRFAYAANVPAELMAQGGEPLEEAICAIPIHSRAVLGIPDMAADERTRQDPCVVQYGCRGYLGYPIIHSSGKVLGVICVLRSNRGGFGEYDYRVLQMFSKRAAMEIERLEADVRIQEKEKEMWDTVQYAPVNLWRIFPDGRFQMISRKGRAELGYPEQGPLEFTWFEMVHPDDVAEIRRKIGETAARAAENGTVTTPVRLRKGDGDYGNFFTTIRPIFDTARRLKLLEGVTFEIPSDET
ncbi:MAG: hypothetical protein A3G34_04235 [Candidatus Lindowbacteria bacterium RIFCSPLOWO2_12_FULL_62_27]|nr:MAG: hypothetical protein A3G34_04235 [Candidatus Lindowbacteria bacterium RIFCSPLOWO2_12_FULL_62_27]